jgi:uncharacterized protein (DUF305 family)
MPVTPFILSITLSLLVVCLRTVAAPIVQPGAPGESSRLLSAGIAIQIANTSHTPDDIQFIQDMMVHHQQALDMAVLAKDRTNSPGVLDASGRIEASQADEIAFMTQWLTVRGEPLINQLHADDHQHHVMMGMATPAQMQSLRDATGSDFDRHFLSLMITHHEGALEMVETLMEQPGAAYDPTLFEFTTDIVNDQEKEIERMHGLLVGLSDDPRAHLAAGLYDAEEAIWHLEKVAVLTKPPGFYDPANPAELPAARFMVPAPIADVAHEVEAGTDHHMHQSAEHEKPGKIIQQAQPDDIDQPTEGLGQEQTGTAGKENSTTNTAGTESADEQDKPEARAPLLSFSNTDIAFWDNIMVAGSYHGFNLYELTEKSEPSLLASIVCPGGQGDVSIVGHLLILSVEETRGRVDCGLEGIRGDISADRFRGIRIFDISDLTQPRQVGAVQTCRGSHTHSVVAGPDEQGKLIVYNSGISRVREEEELAGCIDESPGDNRTALFRIDVIEIPVDDPANARIIDSPTVFADPETGALSGLWRGGDHGDETQETYRTDQCHDITVFPSLQLAAGACSGNGILFDISDPRRPERIDVATDTGFAYWHSATFNNDGSKVIFTDEWGGGTRPRCRTYDPLTWGADAIYDIVDGKLVFQSHYKMSAPQLETENCVAHNGSIIPVPGRDIFVQAWYQGGLSIIDFTDSTNPIEIAYFDRGPIDAEDLVTGGYWSTYWYNGHIYGTEIIRGIDVFALKPSDYLTANEIAAATLADQGGQFNPQQQLPNTWPATPIVGMAYLDQWVRAHPNETAKMDPLYDLLREADVRLTAQESDTALSAELQQWAQSPAVITSPALREVLEAISARLMAVETNNLVSMPPK